MPWSARMDALGCATPRFPPFPTHEATRHAAGLRSGTRDCTTAAGDWDASLRPTAKDGMRDSAARENPARHGAAARRDSDESSAVKTLRR